MITPSRLICHATGEVYDPGELRWCSARGGLLDVEFAPALERALLTDRAPALWRYREAIPLAPDMQPVSLGESVTPLVRITIAGFPVLFKQDHLFPTGSYKDRGAAVMMTRLFHLGVRHVVEDSSGNAGCAVAAYAARAGIACDIFVPASTSSAKLVQMEVYGARVHRIAGSRDDVALAAREAAAGAYYASHVWDPYFVHGTKTFAYEVAEQLGWQAPDAVVVPVGNGTLLLGAFLGFTEMHRSGLITRMPRLVGVQTRACDPLAATLAAGAADLVPVRSGPTVAEGIAIGRPARWNQILQAVRATGGTILSVSEGAIRQAALTIGRKGYYIEPTAAVAVAGVEELLTLPGEHETIVSVFTGSGLKAGHLLGEMLHS